MGLPSGVLWASCNIGASSPSESGLYFSWGNTDGHAVGDGYDFSEEVYNQTPAAAISADLSLSQDAARAYLGAQWRMPTAAEFQELCDNCTSLWTTLGGIKGRLFTSLFNGNQLFFPAAGNFFGTSLVSRGSYGFYLSSTYVSATNARLLDFSSSLVDPQRSTYRRRGYPVRAVWPAT